MSLGVRRLLTGIVGGLAAYQLCVAAHAAWYHHEEPPFLVGLVTVAVAGGLGAMVGIWILQGFQADRMKRSTAPLS